MCNKWPWMCYTVSTLYQVHSLVLLKHVHVSYIGMSGSITILGGGTAKLLAIGLCEVHMGFKQKRNVLATQNVAFLGMYRPHTAIFDRDRHLDMIADKLVNEDLSTVFFSVACVRSAFNLLKAHKHDGTNVLADHLIHALPAIEPFVADLFWFYALCSS